MSQRLVLSRRVVLGSTSRAREVLLTEIVPSFSTASPDIDERAHRHPNPEVLVTEIATAKADAVIEKIGPTDDPYLLVTSDQLAVFNGDVRGKPKDGAQLHAWLREYRFQSLSFITSVVVSVVNDPRLINSSFLAMYRGVSMVKLTVGDLPEHVIAGAVSRGHGVHFASGIMMEDLYLRSYLTVQRHGARGTDGSMVDALASIKGLPLWLTGSLLTVADSLETPASVRQKIA